MLDIKKLTQQILENKIKNNFPTNEIFHEFELMKKEVIEAQEVLENKYELAKELADITIFIMSIARIAEIDLEKSIKAKIKFNKTRTYKKGTRTINGIL